MGQRHRKEVDRLFQKHLHPQLYSLRMEDIVLQSLTSIIDDIVEDRPAEAHHVHTRAKALF
jgi:hypothetical protein